jgi:hypothetical protein
MKQIRHLWSSEFVADREEQDKPVPFEDVPLDPELAACVRVVENMGIAFQSAVPVIANWLCRVRPLMRRAINLKKRMISRNISNAVQRLKEDPDREGGARCAVDQIVWRETMAAKKAGVLPDYDRRSIHDEASTTTETLLASHHLQSTLVIWIHRRWPRHNVYHHRLVD